MKKLLVMLLVLLLALGIGCALAQEEFTCGDFVYTLGEDGTGVITDYNGNDEELVIPVELNGVTAMGAKVFYQCPGLTLTVPLDSYAMDYAEQRRIDYIYPDSLDWLNN